MTAAAFPPKLTDPRAFEIALALLEGFDRHYRLFRATSAEAKVRFERGDWQGQQRAQALRIEFYDTRVAEASALLEARFAASGLPMAVWQQVKLHYIGLLTNHHQPELAETFFNSVCTRILHHAYFHNDFIFVRPAISTEYIENDEPAALPTYRAYYPAPGTLRDTLRRVITNFQLDGEFAHLDADVDRVLAAVKQQLGEFRWRANFQLQVLSSLFYRNKGAYVVGKIINGFSETPFALPILRRDRDGAFFIDAALFGEDDLLMLFSFARAYFLVDMEVPSAYVQFLRSMMPRKPRSEIYSALGLQKQGKNLFYRDFLYHLKHSSDSFRIAPGIKGMVMLVFDLPSWPFVFKVIKDFYPPQKDTSRELIQSKYLLVKTHDRVGRMADTLEYTRVAFPRHRFEPELIAELRHFCPSLVEETGDDLVIRHLYIERRMVPLNIYLQDATPEQVARVVVEYGNAIKDLVAANIFPGDMLWKNFGVTRHGKVVFYDYDEIEYLSDCNFRRLPEPRNEEEEMSGEVWWPVAPRDVFPETFGPFLLGNPQVRESFMRHHADLLDAGFWQAHKERILAGHVHDVFPYDPARRFAAG
ncbi:bifunctional isocitrate dehydrogenase kinase/phosphatase [Pelomonas aquatica]|jgi:isocitrate dehydrogenase kinase/phosphatase|uniref:Isocitrate dehydrogenase kinase/phosphatase n=1 Tax=Pelomonas aquatica TaxID=431058 RepID=A0A9X4LLZ2_9BURK|nr:bifunctional isocitrate dehydrogenase kinase/phosphatase [Pelomonas aquatica]MCY4756258.1 bifunctional isocitrate dehydrogenase kinase/phosphatase [Pelomonas aquatica]MDG0865114.1 bifunctional isocitrate dehydrogenase kinase/phosphatase [Pelomonas aquatica]